MIPQSNKKLFMNDNLSKVYFYLFFQILFKSLLVNYWSNNSYSFFVFILNKLNINQNRFKFILFKNTKILDKK